MSNTVSSDAQIEITTPNGDPHTVEVSLDMRVDTFVQELVPELRLANIDAEGHQVVWHLYSKATGRALERDQTLAQNGVQAGHRLHLVRKTVAGRPA